LSDEQEEEIIEEAKKQVNTDPVEVKIIKEKEEIVEEDIDYADISITEEDKKYESN